MSDKFDDFLDRLERPLSEPVIVTMADRAIEAQIACVKYSGTVIQRTLCAVMSAGESGRKPVSKEVIFVHPARSS